MKKLFIVLAAFATFASCSKMEVQYEQPKEIAISAVSMNRTKAMVSDTKFPNENFAVWAYYKQLPAGTSIADWQQASEQEYPQNIYINNKQFKPSTTEGLWSGVTPYFWPKIGSLLFAGYYPVTMNNVSYEFTSTVNKMTVAGYTPGNYQTSGFVNTDKDAKYVEDFMYFNMTSTSCDARTTGPANNVKDGYHVDVVFKHALSWLTVVLKKDSYTPTSATITVKKVYFTKVNTTGTGTVDNSPVSGKSNIISWETTTAESNVYVLGSSTNDNTTALTDDYTCIQPVIIPQQMDGNIVIVYEIKSSDGSSFTETKTISLSSLDNDSDVDMWDPAKHYTYIVTIGTSEILIDPIIDEWADVTTTIDAK